MEFDFEFESPAIDLPNGEKAIMDGKISYKIKTDGNGAGGYWNEVDPNTIEAAYEWFINDEPIHRKEIIKYLERFNDFDFEEAASENFSNSDTSCSWVNDSEAYG